MRVTDSMLFRSALQDNAAARSRLEAAIGPASTGLRVSKPGDDPAAAGLVTQAAAAEARAVAIGSAAQRASDELSSTDAALNDVTTALARLRELATQFGSAGYSAAQRATAAEEVRSLQAQIVTALNTQSSGRYVMGGTQDGQPPFDAAGNYTGAADVRRVEVAPGVLQDASVRADVAVRGAGGGTDLFATMAALQTALLANDQAGVAAALTPLSTATDQISLARTQAGIDMSTFDASVAASRSVADAARTEAAHLTEADAIEANTALAQMQLALQASLSATAQGFELTLLDYLT